MIQAAVGIALETNHVCQVEDVDTKPYIDVFMSLRTTMCVHERTCMRTGRNLRSQMPRSGCKARTLRNFTRAPHSEEYKPWLRDLFDLQNDLNQLYTVVILALRAAMGLLIWLLLVP